VNKNQRIREEGGKGGSNIDIIVYHVAIQCLFAGSSGLASYTPSKVDLSSEGFELGITRAVPMVVPSPTASAATEQIENSSEVECLRPAQDAGAWGSETTGDLLY